ncbi:MAG: mechanosensitive ion channel family protein, partial [Acidimicrobiales bacterium]
AEDQARVTRLAGEIARDEGARKEALTADLELLKAQVELDQDEVDDAGQDLVRAGGSPADRIQQMAKEHEAAAHAAAGPTASAPGAEEDLPGGRGLVHQFRLWSLLRAKQALLSDAAQEALTTVSEVSAAHAGLEKEIETMSGAATAAGGKDAAALVSSTRRIGSARKALARYDQRMSDGKELARVYGRWGDLVAAEQRIATHDVLLGVLAVLLIVLVGLVTDSLLERYVGRTGLDRRQVEQLRTLTRVSLRVVGVVLALLVIAGPPRQVATYLGLAGAGLTVALKDFIVGFIGWFVLMGRNGIRVGDWVEINGVSGEVVDLGPLHTVLLETGNWAESGHPTGRRVTFVNNFAIEGHYINCSTSGQWLWDEVQFQLMPRQDPAPIVEAIAAIVARGTQANARLAEQEWRRVARSKELQGFSAEPTVSIRPAGDHMQVIARYITRASERHQVRSRLYHDVVELLGRGTTEPPRPAA